MRNLECYKQFSSITILSRALFIPHSVLRHKCTSTPLLWSTKDILLLSHFSDIDLHSQYLFINLSLVPLTSPGSIPHCLLSPKLCLPVCRHPWCPWFPILVWDYLFLFWSVRYEIEIGLLYINGLQILFYIFHLFITAGMVVERKPCVRGEKEWECDEEGECHGLYVIESTPRTNTCRVGVHGRSWLVPRYQYVGRSNVLTY